MSQLWDNVASVYTHDHLLIKKYHVHKHRDTVYAPTVSPLASLKAQWLSQGLLKCAVLLLWQLFNNYNESLASYLALATA